jgi:chromate transporter
MSIWRLGSRAVRGYRLAVFGAAAALAALLGVNEILALFGGGLLGMAWLRLADRPAGAKGPRLHSLAWLPGLWRLGAPWAAALAAPAGPVTFTGLALYFLKIGAVLYGSGYVLIAFLQGDLVQHYGWLTQQQLLDAVAAGQVTPGPLLSTASFIGYLLAGPAGAALCSAAVFTPSFLFVIIVRPIVPRLRNSPWSAAFLDAINVSSIGLMLAVTIKLAVAAVAGWQSLAIIVLAGAAAWRWRLNSAWLVLGGAIAGVLLSRI